VTVQLSLSYLHMARPGDWIIAEADVVRASRDLAFLEGRVSVGDRDVVKATAVFKLMHDRG
jgi:acyl-coenzyme A thioesterase PaaI-like protein